MLLTAVINPPHHVVGLEPHARPDLDGRQAKISAKPANVARRALQKLRQILHRPEHLFVPVQSDGVASIHHWSLRVNRCLLLSQKIHSDWEHNRHSEDVESRPYLQRRMLVISILLLRGMGGMGRQKSVKLKNVFSWDLTGGRPTLGHERLT